MVLERSSKHLLPIAIAAAALLFAGCSKKVESTGDSHGSTTSHAPAVNPVQGDTASKPSTNSVYFAFDRSDLDSAARATLDAYAAYLNADAGVSITIEGNCDERGSREYNLALGQRRADSVRDYLSAQGVNASRVDTVSFGEERPACTTSGEACWAQNRRGDIVTR